MERFARKATVKIFPEAGSRHKLTLEFCLKPDVRRNFLCFEVRLYSLPDRLGSGLITP